MSLFVYHAASKVAKTTFNKIIPPKRGWFFWNIFINFWFDTNPLRVEVSIGQTGIFGQVIGRLGPIPVDLSAFVFQKVLFLTPFWLFFLSFVLFILCRKLFRQFCHIILIVRAVTTQTYVLRKHLSYWLQLLYIYKRVRWKNEKILIFFEKMFFFKFFFSEIKKISILIKKRV